MVYTTLDIDETGESIIVIIIQPENLRRMRDTDPITLESANRGGLMRVPKYPQQLSLLIAYEKDEDEIYRMVREGRIGDLMRHLERGRKFLPGVDGSQNSFRIPVG